MYHTYRIQTKNATEMTLIKMESFLYKRYILIFHYGDNSQTGRYNFGSRNKVVCSNLLKSNFNLISLPKI